MCDEPPWAVVLRPLRLDRNLNIFFFVFSNFPRHLSQISKLYYHYRVFPYTIYSTKYSLQYGQQWLNNIIRYSISHPFKYTYVDNGRHLQCSGTFAPYTPPKPAIGRKKTSFIKSVYGGGAQVVVAYICKPENRTRLKRDRFKLSG